MNSDTAKESAARIALIEAYNDQLNSNNKRNEELSHIHDESMKFSAKKTINELLRTESPTNPIEFLENLVNDPSYGGRLDENSYSRVFLQSVALETMNEILNSQQENSQ